MQTQAIVVDCGSGITKAGMAGDERPSAYFSTCIGKPKHPRVMASGAVEGDRFIGSSVQQHRGLLKLSYPMEHGIVTNWEQMEQIWTHIYDNELKLQPQEHPVLVTEPPLNPRRNREKMCQMAFETFNVPAVQISIQAVLSLYASGRTTGVVLDSGDGVTHCVPIYEGFAISNAIQRMDLAGRDITNRLRILLQKSGYPFNTSAENEIVRIMKEQACYVAKDVYKEEQEFLFNSHKRRLGNEPLRTITNTTNENLNVYDNKSKPDAHIKMSSSIPNENEFILPDGNTIRLGMERFLAPEALFNPSIVGLEYPGIHELLIDTISRSDMDLRSHLYSNIVLSGGTTMYKGFGERLLFEVRKNITPDVSVKIFAPPERKLSTWVGGSILASLSTFKKMWVTAQEYQEDPNVIHRKFL